GGLARTRQARAAALREELPSAEGAAEVAKTGAERARGLAPDLIRSYEDKLAELERSRRDLAEGETAKRRVSGEVEDRTGRLQSYRETVGVVSPLQEQTRRIQTGGEIAAITQRQVPQ